MAKRQGDQRDDDPGPFPAVEDEAADQPVERDHRDQVGEDDPQHEIRAGDRDARSLLEQVAARRGEPRGIAPVGDAGLAAMASSSSGAARANHSAGRSGSVAQAEAAIGRLRASGPRCPDRGARRGS